MSVRMRHTKSHTKNRRSHHALVGTNVLVDKESGKLRLPHRLDESTGKYRGKQVVVAKAKSLKKSKTKGPSTSVAHDHTHEKREHEHENADRTRPRGFFGRVMNARPKARSGAGGGGA